MSTEAMIMAVTAPLLWTVMWQLLRKYRVVRHGGLRIGIVASWMALGDLFLAYGRNIHIPGLLELLFLPLTPFRAADQYAAQASLRGVTPDQWVYYEVFGMFVRFLILVHCISVHQFLWQRAPGKEIVEGPDEIYDVEPHAPAAR